MKRYWVEFFNDLKQESYNTVVEAEGQWNAAEIVANELDAKQDKRAYWPMKVITLGESESRW